MKHDDLISVIVPVYNVEEYIDQCIESICTQTYPNLEIILVDDGSTDKSGEKCDQWAEKDKRIRVVHQDNAGVSAGRNRGLSMMTGDYFTFIDSDDYWDIDYVAFLLDLTYTHNAAISVCGTRHIGFPNRKDAEVSEENDQPKVLTGADAVCEVLLARSGLGGSACRALFRKREQSTLFASFACYEDLLFMAEQMSLADRVVISKVNKYNYRYRLSGSSSIPAEKRMNDLRNVVKLLEELNDRIPVNIMPYIDQRFIKSTMNELREPSIDKKLFQQLREEVLERNLRPDLLNSSNVILYRALKAGNTPFRFVCFLYKLYKAVGAGT